MKLEIKKMVYILLIIGLTSCTSYINQEMSYIHKGMSLDEVTDVIVSDDFSEGINLINDSRDTEVYDISMNNQKGIKFLVTEKYFQDENGFYVFLFQDDKLIYWGLPYEFVNNRNDVIKNASVEISNTIVNKYLED